MRRFLPYILISTILIIGACLLTRNLLISKDSNNLQKPNSINTTCPYYVDKSFPKEYFSDIFNEVMVTYPPYLITSNDEIVEIKEKFDSSKSPYGEKLYVVLPNDAWQERKFDVDNDGKDERILSGDTAMNHTPNLAVVVKDGYIIFKAKGANVYISESGTHSGFFFNENVDWNTGEYRTTRYIYKEGKFIPVWFQTSCAVRPYKD